MNGRAANRCSIGGIAMACGIASVALLTLARPAAAVVVLGGTNPVTGRNESTPTGPYTNSGWQWHGSYGGYSGTPIAPNWFISAEHVYNLQPATSTFSLNSQTYNIVSSVQIPNTDLRLFQVSQTFISFAPIFNPAVDGPLTAGDDVTMFGRGFRRGTEVSGRGWLWGADDAVRSWGANDFDALVDGGPSLGALLVTDFDNNGDPNEGALSARDSGGATYVFKNGAWRLVGVNYGTDYRFLYAPSGTSHNNGTLYDKAGLYQYLGDVNGSGTVDAPDYYAYPTESPQPQASYASYVSATSTLAFINATVPEPGTISAIGAGLIGFLGRRRPRPTQR